MPGDRLTVRFGRPDDAETLDDIARAAWMSAYVPSLLPAAVVASYFASGSVDAMSFAGQRGPEVGTLVAAVDGAPAGMARLRRYGSHDVELMSFHVLPAHQGRGIGTRMWPAIVKRATAVGGRTLRIWTFSAGRSRSFYERQGCVARETGTFSLDGVEREMTGYALDL